MRPTIAAHVLGQCADDLPRASLADEPRFDTEQLTACLERLSEQERSVLVSTFHSERTAFEVAQRPQSVNGTFRKTGRKVLLV